MKNKILFLLSIFVFCFMILVPVSSFGVTEEEQAEIDNIVSNLKQSVTNTYGSGGYYGLEGCNYIMTYIDETYNGTEIKYFIVKYWNDQFDIRLDDNVITFNCVWTGLHDYIFYFFDSDFNLVYKEDHQLYNGESWTRTTIEGYFYSTFTVKNSSGAVVEPVYISDFINPFFITTKEELESCDFDVLAIDSGSLDYDDNVFVFRIFEKRYIDESKAYYNNVKSFVLNSDSPYQYVADLNIYYYIPFNELGIEFSNGKEYAFGLDDNVSPDSYDFIEFTVTGLTAEEEQDNKDDLTHQKMDEQTAAIEEQTEVNKGIWGTLLEVLSYINPVSENFFVYKLVDLLIEMLKGLFVPGDNFFIDWINDLNDYFGDRFGIIYYPFELIINFLTRVGDISNGDYSTAVIKFGDLKLFDTVLINGFEFDFFSLLTNDVLKNIHDIYLLCVDVILYLGLVLLAKNTFAEIFGGHFVDEVISDTTADERSYARYERYESNKSRYKDVHGGGNK